jgi:transposase-like protein
MRGERRTFSREFKLEAVRLLEEGKGGTGSGLEI